MTEDFLENLQAEDNEERKSIPRSATVASSSPMTRPHFAASHGISLRDVLYFIFKHRWGILIPFVIVAALGTAYTFTLTPWYEASATVQIQPNELAALTPALSQERQRNLLNDQVQILRSDSMLERVVEVLRLDTRLSALLGEDISAADRVTGAIGILKQNVLTIQSIMDTNFIRITASLPSADLAATIPNTLASEYVTAIQESIARRATQLSGRYDEEARKAQDELNKIDLKISNFLAENGIPDMAQRFESLRIQADRLDVELRAAQREENKVARNITALEEELAKEPATISSSTQIASNPEYLQIQDVIDALESEKASLAGLWKEGSKKMETINQQIREAQAALENVEKEKIAAKIQMTNPRHGQILNELIRLRPQLEATREDIKNLGQSLKDVNQQIADHAKLRERYVDMLGDKTRFTTQLEFAREKAGQAQTTGKFATEIAEVKIADEARKPFKEAGPNHLFHFFVSLALGFGVGVGFSALREIFSHSIETAADVNRYLGSNLLGSIPDKALTKK